MSASATASPTVPTQPQLSPEVRDYPFELARLLGADSASSDSAWSSFIERYSGLLLHVARSRGGGEDEALDRYVYVLEELRREHFRRLRTFEADGRSRFTTWLVVVARRLCVDHHRRRYGRVREEQQGEGESSAARRSIVDLLAASTDPDLLPSNDQSAEHTHGQQELSRALQEAVQSLDPADQLLLRLRFEDDLSGVEIALLLKMSTPFHVYRRLDRVLGILRQTLVRSGVDGAFP